MAARAVSVAALALALVPAGCDRQAQARRESIAAALAQRAPHLPEERRRRLRDGFLRAESEFDVDVFLLMAVAERESHFRSDARGPQGSLGLLQIRPGTGRAVAERHDIEWPGDHALLEPVRNIRIGAAYLAEMRERFGSWDLALTAYSHGPTRARKVARRGRIPSSRYAAHVMKTYRALREAHAPPDDAEARRRRSSATRQTA